MWQSSTHTQQQQPTRHCHLEVCASCEDGRGAREVNVSQARSHFGDAPIRLIVQAPEAAAERHTQKNHPSHIECGSEQETKEACWLANTRVLTHTRAHTRAHTHIRTRIRTHTRTYAHTMLRASHTNRPSGESARGSGVPGPTCVRGTGGRRPPCSHPRAAHNKAAQLENVCNQKRKPTLCTRARTRTLTHAFTLGCLGGLFAHALASSGSPSHGHPLWRHQTQEK